MNFIYISISYFHLTLNDIRQNVGINHAAYRGLKADQINRIKEYGNGIPYDEKAKGKYWPVLDLKIGDKIKVSVPKKGYDKYIDNI